MCALRVLHLAIRSRDIPRATAFYRDGLGFREIGPRPSGSGSMDLTDGHLNLTIVPFVGTPREPAEEGLESIHFGILVDDAPALYRRLRALGAEIARHDVKTRDDPTDTPPDRLLQSPRPRPQRHRRHRRPRRVAPLTPGATSPAAGGKPLPYGLRPPGHVPSPSARGTG